MPYLPEGMVQWFLILHSTQRLLVERFRGDDRGLIPGSEMSITQLVAVLVLLSAVVMIFVLKSKAEKGGDPELKR